MVYGSTAIRILVSRTNLHLVFGISYEKCLRGKNMELFSKVLYIIMVIIFDKRIILTL